MAGKDKQKNKARDWQAPKEREPEKKPSDKELKNARVEQREMVGFWNNFIDKSYDARLAAASVLHAGSMAMVPTIGLGGVGLGVAAGVMVGGFAGGLAAMTIITLAVTAAVAGQAMTEKTQKMVDDTYKRKQRFRESKTRLQEIKDQKESGEDVDNQQGKGNDGQEQGPGRG